MKKLLLAWSSGKDSAWTLHALRQQNIEVSALLTTITSSASRVAMHGVRRELLELQAAAVGLPVWQIPLPWPCTNDDYEARMADACRRAVAEGFGSIAFGDLYLQDVRAYRERQLAGSGLAPVFPLWELPTAILARDMIDGGLRARLSCIDSRQLDPAFAGREFDRALLADLPPTADPCGENGEFHSFVYAGPMFREPIPIECGEVRNIDGFIYTDLLCPVSSL
uniref:Diphthamide synthase domain-containing protein n=1 Tax=Solibacter usitatus (strain Ellin6076) TaxID=234267 RepID=Q02CS6_SOLUE